MSQPGVENQQRMKNRFSDCRPCCQNEHIMRYTVQEKAMTCSWCGRDSMNTGECTTCSPVFGICETCAESRNRNGIFCFPSLQRHSTVAQNTEVGHSNSYGRTANEASSSRSWSTAPCYRPANSWGTRGSDSTGRSDNSWWDSAGKPQTWSREDSQQGSRWQGGWRDYK